MPPEKKVLHRPYRLLSIRGSRHVGFDNLIGGEVKTDASSAVCGGAVVQIYHIGGFRRIIEAGSSFR